MDSIPPPPTDTGQVPRRYPSRDIAVVVALGVTLVIAYIPVLGLTYLTEIFSRHRWTWPTLITAAVDLAYTLAFAGFLFRELWRLLVGVKRPPSPDPDREGE